MLATDSVLRYSEGCKCTVRKGERMYCILSIYKRNAWLSAERWVAKLAARLAVSSLALVRLVVAYLSVARLAVARLVVAIASSSLSSNTGISQISIPAKKRNSATSLLRIFCL
jgi:hypothetical protein